MSYAYLLLGLCWIAQLQIQAFCEETDFFVSTAETLYQGYIRAISRTAQTHRSADSGRAQSTKVSEETFAENRLRLTGAMKARMGIEKLIRMKRHGTLPGRRASLPALAIFIAEDATGRPPIGPISPTLPSASGRVKIKKSFFW